ncbi:winged helix-turn-helix transcriptional regulator [Pedobacter antarcticus]|uniref:winged helix-turn-helix transcriptional regulator n=1 Tax=Pedobacter antarcticus TaxID=34086 RepID=UPI001C59E83A|nr:winged helix-turn-helix transcriptional regulator [Pedobacter antarcticus]
MLSKELKDLEINSIVKRTVIDSTPVLIRYSLTESAMGLSDKILGLVEWGVQHRKDSIEK